MNILTKLTVFGLSTLSLCVSASAQKARHSVAVAVTCTCDDVTGKAYASALHAALAKSTHYKEVSAAQDPEGDAIRINIISMPLEENQGRPQSALSIVCLHDGALMHQFVETCTHIPIEDCAQSMVDSLLQWTDKLPDRPESFAPRQKTPEAPILLGIFGAHTYTK